MNIYPIKKWMRIKGNVPLKTYFMFNIKLINYDLTKKRIAF